MKTIFPTKESIKFAKESAEEIGNISITAEPRFYFDVKSKNSNSIDEEFLISLEKGKHLNDNFLSIK
ncbi:hypothetical protein [uncultured Gammaproteobacteria bacterium]|jgi:hypothetical protein|nr:hypothetical protein [uncultured Gammaproteobacteria bacterium]CAC9541785.1 hypothetical protein [uncultured Gammaproteobacteria bacterium]CAC9551768.1 hypothetical protein [uncultured Gammaproteobacteria bacterium]